MQGEAPQYIDVLSGEDIKSYKSLRETLNGSDCRNCRNKRLENFSQMMNNIKSYAIKKDGDDWKRCLVCGICWISDGIAINTHQLSLLLGKCKSSINGSLHRMKYVPFPSSNQASKELMELIPRLKQNFAELRQWTLRKHVAYTPQPVIAEEYNDIFLGAACTPAPQSATDLFASFEDDNQEKLSFFNDPISIPLNEWSSSWENHAEAFNEFSQINEE